MLGALSLLALASGPKWVLTLDQSFAGTKGKAPNAKVWARDLGGDGWGNDELETYTDGAANAFLDGQGHLVIEARMEGARYTSARLKTQGRFEQRYGKIEARMMLPRGRGIWPAFWALGSSLGTKGWPGCGEIDVLENVGQAPNTVYGTLHGPGYSGAQGIGDHVDNATLSTAFHNYTVEWSPTKVVWSLDGAPYHTVNAADVGNKDWPFERPFFLLLNLAVGGGWPGNPDATTVFPQRLIVDYVRVWKDANLKVDEAALARYHSVRMYGPHDYRYPGPFKLPGTIPLADYLPDEGAGYHDEDYLNEGGSYRYDGVDLQASGGADVPYNVGWTHAGEWLTYSVDVAKAGSYVAQLSSASLGAGGKVGLFVDGKRLAGTTLPDTGSWTVWRLGSLGKVALKAGRHTVKLAMEANGPGGSVGNVSSLEFTKA